MLKGDYAWGIHISSSSMYVSTYTKLDRSRDGMEVKSMMELVLVKRDDMSTVRGTKRAVSDHPVVPR